MVSMHFAESHIAEMKIAESHIAEMKIAESHIAEIRQSAFRRSVISVM
jgi:hypothetical protein